MNNENDLLVEVKDLEVLFFLTEGIVRAVSGISFEIRQGRTLGVIGESGSGKSVTAQSIMGLLPSPPAKQTAGDILLYGELGPGGSEIVNISKLSQTGRQIRNIRGKEISMIFQEPMTSFSPVHTIGDQIMESILLHLPDMNRTSARNRAIEYLGLVGIPQPQRQVDAYPHEFSGGMRQRAMIAMALSCNPRLVIADEPTTALDVTIEAQILDLLRRLQADFGMAIMYISHDLAVVSSMADEVIVMYLGLIMEQASAKDVFEDPGHPYTRALWRSIPKIDGPLETLTPISGSLPSPFAVHRGCPFYSRCEERLPDVCNLAQPPIVEIKPKHTVRCFLYTDERPSQDR